MGSETAGRLLAFARDELLAAVEDADEQIRIASPFLTVGIADRIAAAAADSSAGEKRLLTALVPGSVQAGVLDPQGLQRLQECGFSIASISNLHAKVSLVDSNWGLVGSGNLTNAGLASTDRSNVELGVVLSRAQIVEAAALFEEWWSRAERVSSEALEQFAALPRFDRHGTDDFGPPIDLGQIEELAQILAEDEPTAQSRGYWIKSNYHRVDEEAWWHRGWISDWRQASYAVGDLIVLYLSAKDGGPAVCPAVVRVVKPSRHDPDWVASHRDPEAAEQWPFVTETSLVADVPIRQGVQLSALDISPQALQGGYRRIDRRTFETAAMAMSR